MVDEAGRPIDGATVAPRSASPEQVMRRSNAFDGRNGAVQTVDGRFELSNLPRGEELLRVTHPDYVYALSEPIELTGAAVEAPRIVMRRGGSVRGVVYDAAGAPRPGVTIYFHTNSNHLGGVFREERALAAAVTDAAGRYEANHLPGQLCYAHLADESDTEGVVRTAIKLVDGDTRTLDFGGPGGFTGRLVADGEPLAGVRVRLAGDDPHFGAYKSIARTDADGRFALGRPPVGRWTVWFQAEGRHSNWLPAAEAVFPASTAVGETIDLGDLEFRGSKVSVAVEGMRPDELASARVSLFSHDPHWWTLGRKVGNRVARGGPDGPAVFENVWPGEHQARVYRADEVVLVEPIRVDAGVDQTKVSVAWPTATGALEIEVAADLLGDEDYRAPRLRSVDGRLGAYVRARPGEETARFERLPAGDYYLTDQDTRDAQRVVEFKVVAGETTTLRLDRQSYQPEPQPMGYLRVRWFSPEHEPLPGVEGTVVDDAGQPIERVSQRDGEWTCIGAPGEYVVTGRFPGCPPVATRVVLDPPEADGSIQGEPTVDLVIGGER